MSSYRARLPRRAAPITASLPVGQGAACWVAVSPNGRFAYTGNAAGGISGFAIGRDGSLTRARHRPLLARRRATSTSTRAGRFLHAVSPGGQVTAYRVGHDGSLKLAGAAPAAAGLTGAAAL